MNLLTTINLALRAYILWVESEIDNQLDSIEDEIDKLAATGTPAAKLRIERLSQRLNRKRERTLRSRDDTPT